MSDDKVLVAGRARLRVMVCGEWVDLQLPGSPAISVDPAVDGAEVVALLLESMAKHVRHETPFAVRVTAEDLAVRKSESWIAEAHARMAQPHPQCWCSSCESRRQR